jgi:hypothetical protein
LARAIQVLDDRVPTRERQRFEVRRCITDSGRSKIWGAYDTLRSFPGMLFRKGTEAQNRELAERAAAVLNAGEWRDREFTRVLTTTDLLKCESPPNCVNGIGCAK